ncbi:hypothetical protein PS2_034718 [Malus domestica]
MIGSALEVKLFVARQVVLLAQDCCPSGSSIIFEGDSSLVLAAMKGKDDDCSLLGPFFKDLRFLLQLFPPCMVTHVPREGSFAAHCLARMGVGSNQAFLWFEDHSDLIRDVLIEENL